VKGRKEGRKEGRREGGREGGNEEGRNYLMIFSTRGDHDILPSSAQIWRIKETLA
jgi:hypothetical protein